MLYIQKILFTKQVLYFQMEALCRREISRRLSYTLDCLGYNQEMFDLRREFYDKFAILCDLEAGSRHKCSTVGSKGEGSVKCLESDLDLLVQLSDLACIDTPLTSTLTIFQMVPCLYHPGHFTLVLQSIGQAAFKFKDCFKLSNLGVVLSGKLFLNHFKEKNEKISGPAFYSNIRNYSDLVKG